MRVLVCTDDETFAVGLAQAYRDRGDTVERGLEPLLRRSGDFDLVHLHWPEELVGWQVPPEPGRTEAVLETLAWWRTRAQLVCTVHNLLPHAAGAADQRTRDFYLAFYRSVHRIGHFSQTSLEAVLQQFPELVAADHRIHGMNLFQDLLSRTIGRKAARAKLGVGEGRFTVIVLGALRKVEELKLAMAVLSRARLAGHEVLFAARLQLTEPRISRVLPTLEYRIWRRWKGVRTWKNRIEDAELVAILEAADALLIPRLGQQLNSGLLPLAMTFGTPLVSPDQGVFREMLGSSSNILYPPGDVRAAAAGVESLAGRSPGETREHNLALGQGWGWEQALKRLLD